MARIAEIIVRMAARFAMHVKVSGEQLRIWVDEEAANEADFWEAGEDDGKNQI